MRENADQKKLRIWTLFTQCLVLKFTVSLANSHFITNTWNDNANTTDTAIIRSSCVVVFCKKGVLTNFQNSQENTFTSLALKEAADL